MQIQIRTLHFACKFADLRFADWGHQGNLRICELGINRYTFADLRFLDWHTSDICGFAIFGQTKRIFMPTSSEITGHILVVVHTSVS